MLFKDKLKENIFSKYYYVFFLVMVLLIGFLCFNNLNTFAVNDWDEARHGVNAYEMFRNNKWIVNTFNYENDYYNLKPPLSYWCIIMSFKVFGVSVFSLRFYSAVSLLMTAIISAIFVKKNYGNIQSIMFLAMFSACVPFYNLHMGRHGDADALFLLLYTLTMIAMIYIPKNKKMLYVCGFLFSINFLNKSWHVLSIAAIGGLFLIFTGEIKRIEIKQWFLFIVSSILPILVWGVFRFQKDGTRFFKQMINYDLIDRTGQALEGHSESILYYFKYLLIHSPILFLFLFFIMAISIKYYFNQVKLRDEKFIGLFLWLIIPLVLFSIAKTKLEWYIFPVYIPIMIFASINLYNVLCKAKNSIKIVIISYFIVAVGFYNIKLINYTNRPTVDTIQEFLQSSRYSNKDIKGKLAYIDADEMTSWPQRLIFVAEICDDLRFKNGGITEFLHDSNKNSLLLISKAEYKKNSSLLKSFNIRYSQGNYMFISK